MRRISKTFKKRARSETLKPPTEDAVYRLFLGGPHAKTEAGADARAAGIANLSLFLKTFAGRLLDGAHAYNSLKHGLALFRAL